MLLIDKSVGVHSSTCTITRSLLARVYWVSKFSLYWGDFSLVGDEPRFLSKKLSMSMGLSYLPCTPILLCFSSDDFLLLSLRVPDFMLPRIEFV